jgi:hypothetical protein
MNYSYQSLSTFWLKIQYSSLLIPLQNKQCFILDEFEQKCESLALVHFTSSEQLNAPLVSLMLMQLVMPFELTILVLLTTFFELATFFEFSIITL